MKWEVKMPSLPTFHILLLFLKEVEEEIHGCVLNRHSLRIANGGITAVPYSAVFVNFPDR